MFFKLKKSYSLLSLIVVFIFLVVVSFKFNLWKSNKIVIDAPSYYTYLPAVFIYNDLKLDFVDNNPSFFKDKIWYYKIENGNKLIKHPMGISVALTPFFLAGHVFTKITGAPADGYSLIYQNSVTVGVWCYLFLGLFYLRKFLLHFFSEAIVAITLFSIVVSTNLLWYATFEALMPHAVSFALWSVCIYYFYSWLTTENNKHLYLFAALFGLSLLIRPLSITFLIYFILLGSIHYKGFVYFFHFFKRNLKAVFFSMLIAATIFSLQFFYWKYITGSFLFDVYMDEHFVFSSPQFFPFLFSFRKGFFIYTPVMLFSILGLITLFRKYKQFVIPTILLVIITVFLLSSWWAWSYGISWGMRPMIDYYSVLSFPLAGGLSYAFSYKRIKYFFGLLIIVFTLLNLFQTWQYKNALIHYDDMSREAYVKGFFQTKASAEWYDLLKPYNWNRRIKGLPQITYSAEMLDTISASTAIYFRTPNFYYASVSVQADSMFAAFSNKVSNEEKFYVLKNSDNSFSFQSSSGKFLSVKPQSHDMIVADAERVGDNEKFIPEFENTSDNKIYLKSFFGKYIRLDNRLPLLIADATTKKEATFLRFYLFADYNKNP